MIRNTLDRVGVASMAAIIGLSGSSIAFRAVAPSDIFDNDQASPMSHIVDVAFNDNWLLQKNTAGRPAAKPPLFPWIGGLTVRLFGSTAEWVFKLPVILAFLVTGLVVFDLTRRVAPASTAWFAMAIWVANYHTFKLMFTVRTDMLLTMWISIAIWSVQRQRELWQRPDGAIGASTLPVAIGLVLVYGCSVGAGFLTKGPAAVLPLPWLAGCIVADAPGRRCRPGLQILGLVVAFGIFLGWLLPAMAAEPYWWQIMKLEWVDRVTGVGSGRHRSTFPLAVPAYFLGRFAPWSLLFVAATMGFRRWEIGSRSVPSWPIFFVMLVIGIYMIPGGKRADYIVPAYVPASMLGALFLQGAAEQRGWPRVVVHLLFGGMAIGALLLAVLAPWLGREGQLVFELGQIPLSKCILPTTVMLVGMVVVIMAGTTALICTHRRHYLVAGWACCFAVVGILGIYQSTMSRAARIRSGDAMTIVAAHVRAEAAKTGNEIYCRQTCAAGLQALLGVNGRGRVLPEDVPGEGPMLVVTTGRDWQALTRRHPGNHELLLATMLLDHEPVRLIVGRFRPTSP